MLAKFCGARYEMQGHQSCAAAAAPAERRDDRRTAAPLPLRSAPTRGDTGGDCGGDCAAARRARAGETADGRRAAAAAGRPAAGACWPGLGTKLLVYVALF